MINNIDLSEFFNLIIKNINTLDIWVKHINSKGIIESEYHSTITKASGLMLLDATSITAYILAATSDNRIENVNIDRISSVGEYRIAITVSNIKEEY